jgi:hypothetical protein
MARNHAKTRTRAAQDGRTWQPTGTWAGRGRITIVVETASGALLQFPNYSANERLAAMRIACGQSMRDYCPAATVWQDAKLLVRFVDGRPVRVGYDALWFQLGLATSLFEIRERQTLRDLAEGRDRPGRILRDPDLLGQFRERIGLPAQPSLRTYWDDQDDDDDRDGGNAIEPRRAPGW